MNIEYGQADQQLGVPPRSAADNAAIGVAE